MCHSYKNAESGEKSAELSLIGCQAFLQISDNDMSDSTLQVCSTISVAGLKLRIIFNNLNFVCSCACRDWSSTCAIITATRVPI